MSTDLALPPGDPAVLRSTSAALRALARDLDAQARSLRAERDRLAAAWSGTAAARAQVTVTGLAAAADEAAAAMGAAGSAVVAYARALEQARDDVGVLRRRRDDADDDLAHGLRTARHSELDPLAHARAVAALHDAHARALVALGRDRQRVQEECERAGLVLRRALESTRGPLVRGHRQSLEDWYGGIASSLLGRLPVLAEHPDAVRALVWASTSSLPSVARSWTAGTLLGRWALATSRAGGAAVPFTPTNLPLWGKAAQTQSGALRAFFAGDNLLTGATATRGTSLAGIWSASGGAASAAGSAGWFRGAGLVGAGAATVLSAANVVAQGDPVDALQENGAGYVADVSELALNASVTALLVAPNPVTAGVVVVTGLVYAGTELYAHREQIAALATDGVQLAADVGRRGLEVTGDVIGTVDRAVDDAVGAAAGAAVDAARSVGSALNPFA